MNAPFNPQDSTKNVTEHSPISLSFMPLTYKNNGKYLTPLNGEQSPPRNFLRARTLLALAQREDRLDLADGSLTMQDAKGYHTAHVQIYHWRDDLPIINKVLQMTDDPNGRNEETLETFMPHVNQDDLVSEDANEPRIDGQKIKAIMAYSSMHDISWGQAQGWLYMLSPTEPLDFALFSAFLGPSHLWLQRGGQSTDAEDDEVKGAEKVAEILHRRQFRRPAEIVTYLSLLGR